MNLFSKYNRILVAIVLLSISFSSKSQIFKRGLVFDDKSYDKAMLSAPLIKSDYNLPPKASLEKYCPTVKSQGQMGTCTAWATAFYAMTIAEAKKNNWTLSVINQNVFSPTFIYELIKNKNDYNCQDGSNIAKALELVKNKGVPKLKDLPYQCSATITQSIFAKAAKNKIAGYKTLFNRNADKNTKTKTIKKALYEGNPVIIGFNATNSFEEAKDLWQPSYGDTPNCINCGHAMTVVAYDNSKYGGAFKLINSWGRNFGNNGLVWIKYGDFAKYCKYAYEMIPKYNPIIIQPTNINLSGKIVFKLNNGSVMNATKTNNSNKNLNTVDDDEAKITYKMNNNYSSYTKFKFYLSSQKSAYIYALASDLSGKVNKIFPYKNISPYFGYTKNTIVYPSENSSIQMDNSKGVDYLLILYSKRKLNIDNIIQRMSYKSGSFSQKLQYAVGNKLVPENKIKFKTNEISFSANVVSQKQYVVPVMIAIEHK